ncbi:MAG: hypothetical protein ABR865_01440 [Terracidiphilus sp.]|jgi:hypothetical protein
MIYRPFAVKLIAAYLCLKAAALSLCVIAVHLHPSSQPAANGIIEDLVPMLLGIHEPSADFWLAPVFVAVDAALGVGIWLLQGWARVVIVIDLTWLFGRAAVGLLALAAIHPKGLHFHNPSVYFSINVVASLMILVCLVDPDTRRAFRSRD